MKYPALVFILMSFACNVFAQNDSTKIQVEYTDKGFQFNTADKKYLLHIESRLQFRFATPGDEDPVTFDEFLVDDNTVFKINRARLKIGGNAFQPWLKYYFEYELSQSNLLDFRIMVEKWKFLSLKVGQWKVDYNRERSVSSGKQQLADRSIINRYFTLDRQQGVALYGKVNEGRASDLNYWVSVLTGTGRGSRTNDDNNLMYVGRVQWNFLGREIPYTNSDLARRQAPEAYLAVGGVTNRSPFTRFSQSGGGQLFEEFEPGEEGQYRVNQFMFETAFMYKGFSWASETHWKDINDLEGDKDNTLGGFYFQAGYFWNELLNWFPEKLETAVRFAYLDPNLDVDLASEREISIALNYFFHGHRNKLTVEYTNFNAQENATRELYRSRFRIQWDVSL